MPRSLRVLSALILFFSLSFLFLQYHARTIAQSRAASPFSKSAQQKWNARPGRVIVKFKAQIKNAPDAQHELANKYGLGSARPLFARVEDKATAVRANIGLDRVFVFIVSPQMDIAALVAMLQQDPSVEYAEPDYLVPLESIMPEVTFQRAENHAQLAPNDSLYPQQQYLTQVKAPAAWDVARGDSNVIIALIDSGTEWQHPDLAANIWNNPNEALDGVDNDNNGFIDDVRGWDFVDDVFDALPGEDGDTPDNDPSDFVSHGTGVSGVAAAVTNNQRGVAALSWNVRLMPLRVGWMRNDFESVVSTAFSAQAFVYAADNGAHVANLSAGSSRVVADAAQYAFQKGVVITSAAGNGANEEASGLNLAPFAITVAAVNDRDELVSYSSFGEWVKVCAPGGDLKRRRPGILSTTLRGDYLEQQGTSFAAPIVAALAALVKSQHPDWTSAQITFQIVETADAIDALNPEFLHSKLGRGRINAQRALTENVVALPEISLGKIYVHNNANQVLDAGEIVELRLDLQNVWGEAVNLQAQLFTDDYAISILKNTANYGTLPGLSDLSNNTQNNANDPFIITAHADALPHRARFTLALSADNGYQQSFELYLAISPFVLLVDDDHGQNNVENFYTEVLDSLGISFDTYTRPLDAPQFDVLAQYPNVIWLCEWAFPTLDAADRSALAQYLANGGKLFISGQDIGWDLSDGTSGLVNQFFLSQGASRQFFENNLHARYLNDDAERTSLLGVANDPIGNGLAFDIWQPGRTISEQLPDEIAPLAPGVSIFNYSNGRSGALRHEGAHRLVYFAFGGFEAIVQAQQRGEVMQRVLHWLNGFSFEHTPLGDSDDTTRARRVTFKINSTTPLASADLYWDIDGALPFNKMILQNDGNGVYSANIPPQFKRTVEYFMQARNAEGFTSAIQKYSYSTFPDTTAPTIASVSTLPSTLSNVGPFVVEAQASDFSGIDTGAVWLHFRSSSAREDSVRMRPAAQSNIFRGEIVGPFSFGDTLRYHVSVRDLALARNRALSAEQNFIIGFEGFENGLRDWQIDSLGWGVTGVRKFSGAFATNSNPGRGYATNVNTSLTLVASLDLSHVQGLRQAQLEFYEQHYFAANHEDYGVLEISRDGGANWSALENFRGIQSQWQRRSYELQSFGGPGSEDVRLRFRVQTDSLANAALPGWFVDEVRIVESVAVAVTEPQAAFTLPRDFMLHQNFPNPFVGAARRATSIRYELPLNTQVEIAVFDLMGKRVATLVDARQLAGVHVVHWSGNDARGNFATSGIYFCRMQARAEDGRSFQFVRRMLVMQ